MPRQGSRRRLAKYIYQDGTGIAALVCVPGRPRAELRFPLRTQLAEIRRAMEVRAAQLQATPSTRLSPGTTAHVIMLYVLRLGTTLPEQDERGRLKAWTAACGTENFATLTRARINQILEDWRRAGFTQSTIAKRVSSLRKVSRALDEARHDDPPVHAIVRVKRPRTPPSGEIHARDLDLIQRVLDNVTDWNQSAGRPSKTKARLALWAWTGHNPATIQLLQPEHVRWHTDPPQIYVQPRRKGAGVDAAWVPLIGPAIPAVRDFFAREAFGPANKGVLLRAWRIALKKTQAQLLKERRVDEAAQLNGMLPRHMRHSFTTAALTVSNDLYGVAEMMRHADIKTTLQYAKGAASARTKAVVAAFDAALTAGANNGANETPKKRGRKAKEADKRQQSEKAAKAKIPNDLAGDTVNVDERGLSDSRA